MSSYSSLLPLISPADWAAGGDADDMAAAATVSSYLSFDADEEYYFDRPPEVAAVLQLAGVSVGDQDGSSNGVGEAGEQSRQLMTDASTTSAPAAPASSGSDRTTSTDQRLPVLLGARGNKIAFRTRSDVDVLDDGYRWRKYGKKMVKNSPNPRNYYRCSSEGCHVKKRVERERDDARFVVTTYDGVHNHPAPAAGAGLSSMMIGNVNVLRNN